MEKLFNKNYKQFIKDSRRKRQINNFYMKRMKDGKSRKAVFLDSIFSKILISLILYLSLLYFTNTWTLSLIMSIILFGVYNYISYKIKNKIYSQKVADINKEMSNRLISSKIINLSNKEFLEYNKDILERYYNTSFHESNNKDIDLIGKIDGDLYGVKSIKKGLEHSISLRELNNLIEGIEDGKIDKAIVITNTYFTEEVIELGNEGLKNLILINFDELTKILKELELYPQGKEIEDLIHSRREQKRKKILKERKGFFVLNKVIRYFILAIALWVLSYVVSYPLYYRFMSVILIILATIGLFGYLTRWLRDKKEISLHK